MQGVRWLSRFHLAAIVILLAAGHPVPAQASAIVDVDGDGELRSVATTQAWPGSGTATDPFILAHRVLDFVTIYDTTLHLVIANNTFGAVGYAAGTCGHAVLRLYNVAHVRVEGNHVPGLACGILVEGGTDVQVLGNQFSGFRYAALEASRTTALVVRDNVVHASQAARGFYLWGTRGAVIEGNSITSSASGGLLSLGTLGVGRQTMGSDNSVIRGNVLDASSGNAAAAISVDESRDLVIEGNVIIASQHWMGYGFIARSSSGQFSHNTISEARGFSMQFRNAGIGIWPGDWTVQGNHVRGPGVGLLLEAAGAVVADNTFEGPLGEPPVRVAGAGMRFEGNVIDGHDRGGTPGFFTTVHIQAADAGVVANNIIRNVPGGLSVDGQDLVVQGNRIEVVGGLSVGNSFFQAPSAQVVGNTVVDALGISVQGQTPVVRENLVQNSSGHGLFVIGHGALVEDNRVDGAEGAGIYLWYGWGDVRGNHVQGADDGVFVSYAGVWNVVDNVLMGNKNGVQLDHSARTMVVGNTIQDSAADGVVVYKSWENQIFGNTITGSGGYGIQADGSLSNVIYDNFLANARNARDFNACWNSVPPACINWPEVRERNMWHVEPRPGTNVIGGTLVAGNFWSDFTGVDHDGDGLGDSPYVALGLGHAGDFAADVLAGGPVVDAYPLVAGGVVVGGLG